MAEIPFLLQFSFLVILCVITSRASDKFGVPALIIFIVIGMLAGSDGPGGMAFENFQFTRHFGLTALVLILFYGGIDTEWKTIKPVLGRGTVLATLGVVISAGIVAMLAVVFLKFNYLEALLLGAVISSTDAAAVFAVLRSKNINLKGNTKPMLEFESGTNDPIAIFLTIALTKLITEKGASVAALVPAFFMEMIIGAAMGYLFGKMIVIAINKLNLEHEGLYPVLALAFVLFGYALTTAVRGNGFLAVYIMGLVAGNSTFLHKRSLVKFHGGLAWLMQIMMFLVLGLLVHPSKLGAVAGTGIMLGLSLIFIARPISVLICLAGSKFSIREQLMISWGGLRGAVPVILAIIPVIAGVPGAQTILYVVFFIVLLSALMQGTTIAAVAKMLKIYVPAHNKPRYPIEFENMPGMDAEMHEVFIPYNSEVVGKRIFEIGVPLECLVTLVSRDDKFIIPNGSTVIAESDIMLILASKADIKTVENIVNRIVIKKEEEEETEEKDK